MCIQKFRKLAIFGRLASWHIIYQLLQKLRDWRKESRNVKKDSTAAFFHRTIIHLSEKRIKSTDNGHSSLVDRWLVFVILEFVSAAIGFAWGLFTHSILFLFIGGFFFSLGVFAATRLGFDRLKAKQRPRRRSKKQWLAGLHIAWVSWKIVSGWNDQ